VAIFDDTLQVCQILEYKLFHNPEEIKTELVDKRNNCKMSNRGFLNFLKRSLDYAGMDMVGISLIILKKKYTGNNKKIKLSENIDEHGKI
jgi:hypothetical protein